MAPPSNSPRHLSRRRVLALAVLVPLVLWIGLELAAGLALRSVAASEVKDGLTSAKAMWIDRAKDGLRGGMFVQDPAALWVVRPFPPGVDATSREPEWGDEPLRVNSFGHRSPAVGMSKPPGTKRVMVLGGSHPFGMWVGNEQVYSAALERLLNAAGPQRWEVLNAACPGHTTFQGRRYLETIGVQFAPDVVVFDLGINDELPLSLDYASPDHEVGSLPGWVGGWAAVADQSNVYRLLRRSLAAPVGALRDGPGIRVPLPQRLENLAAVQELGEARGFEVLFMDQVSVTGWQGPGRARCAFDPASHGFAPRAAVCAAFAALGDQAGTLFADEVHASAPGHELIARTVLRAMQEQGWVE